MPVSLFYGVLDFNTDMESGNNPGGNIAATPPD
jgi:hypothetical protein